jgi:hypothetical protein
MRHWFDGNRVPNPENMMQRNIFTAETRPEKIPLANFLICITLSGGRSPSGLTPEESQNGLESTEDRRSAGRHGNQHVCLRCPQVSDSKHHTWTKVDCRGDASLLGALFMPASTFVIFAIPQAS